MSTFSKTALYNALGIVVYILLIVLVMSNSNRLFGDTNKFLVQMGFLSLFVLSASVVGGLILGKPLMLYMDNQKKVAVSLFLQTVGWLAGFTVLLLLVLAISK
jgi:hypothetical protein